MVNSEMKVAMRILRYGTVQVVLTSSLQIPVAAKMRIKVAAENSNKGKKSYPITPTIFRCKIQKTSEQMFIDPRSGSALPKKARSA